MSDVTSEELARKIQYTLVNADATREDLEAHCREGVEYGFQAVMVQPCWVPTALEIVSDSETGVATAFAYPMGGETTEMKVDMAHRVVDLGADEFDFQPNIGWLRSGMLDAFEEEIERVVEAAGELPVKVMCEFGFLDVSERIDCLHIAEKAGAAYVKNSSGVGPGGSAATADEMRFMQAHLRGDAKIKASGQIKSRDQALGLLEAGADLIGASAGLAIVEDAQVRQTDY